jgi:mono/diheme cytochrome c family protein
MRQRDDAEGVVMGRRILVAVLAVIAALAAVVYWLNVREETGAPAPAAAADPQRGAYLARVGNCIACHTQRGGASFAGGRAIETPFGTVFSTNLTPDKATGLGEWTSADFWRALHHGRSRDGRLLYPAFPYPNYTYVTREDSDAIFAYLRTLPAVSREATPNRLRWPYSMQASLAVWRAMFFSPGDHKADATKTAEWNRGAYLVKGLGHCSACHTPRNALGASSGMMDLSGGVIPMQNWYAPSLASRGEAGVADWDHAQIERLLRTGTAPRGTVLGPMAEVVLQSTQYLDDADARAMAVFLKDLPQHEGEPVKAPDLPVRVAERGALVYRNNCAQCHGDNGEGVPNAYPALAGNRAVNLPVTANLVQVVLGGGFAPSTAGNPRPFGMPPYATILSDEDVAAVLSHIRMSWGNRSGAVSVLDVTQQRSSTTP